MVKTYSKTVALTHTCSPAPSEPFSSFIIEQIGLKKRVHSVQTGLRIGPSAGQHEQHGRGETPVQVNTATYANQRICSEKCLASVMFNVVLVVCYLWSSLFSCSSFLL